MPRRTNRLTPSATRRSALARPAPRRHAPPAQLVQAAPRATRRLAALVRHAPRIMLRPAALARLVRCRRPKSCCGLYAIPARAARHAARARRVHLANLAARGLVRAAPAVVRRVARLVALPQR